MAKLWHQIKDAVSFAVEANQPIPPEQITDAALICINCTAYKQAYLAYWQLPVRNYNILKTHFEQAERDRHEVKDEAGVHGYGMSAMEQADREMQNSLSDVAAALTSMAGETANGVTASNDPSIQATIQRLETNMASLQQTINAQQAHIANAAQQTMQQPPMMPYCAPIMQQQPLQPLQFNGQRQAGGAVQKLQVLPLLRIRCIHHASCQWMSQA